MRRPAQPYHAASAGFTPRVTERPGTLDDDNVTVQTTSRWESVYAHYVSIVIIPVATSEVFLDGKFVYSH